VTDGERIDPYTRRCPFSEVDRVVVWSSRRRVVIVKHGLGVVAVVVVNAFDAINFFPLLSPNNAEFGWALRFAQGWNKTLSTLRKYLTSAWIQDFYETIVCLFCTVQLTSNL
jgi:hypothetical protein